jgi:pyruvate dehydrogenase E1 component alpha subunit/2-oxoisovalerate dehydrogenase E1 component
MRSGSETYLIEYRTYRYRAHSMYDAELRRSKGWGKSWKPRCPGINFTTLLRGRGELMEADLAAVEGALA